MVENFQNNFLREDWQSKRMVAFQKPLVRKGRQIHLSLECHEIPSFAKTLVMPRWHQLQNIFFLYKNIHVHIWTKKARGRRGTPLHNIYRYVQPRRVGFLHSFGLKTCLHFAHFGLESGWVFEGTTGVYEHFYPFNSKWVRKKEKYVNSK